MMSPSLLLLFGSIFSIALLRLRWDCLIVETEVKADRQWVLVLAVQYGEEYGEIKGGRRYFK